MLLITIPCQNGYTALMWASHKGHTEIVKMLLADSRVDVNLKRWVSDEQECGNVVFSHLEKRMATAVIVLCFFF